MDVETILNYGKIKTVKKKILIIEDEPDICRFLSIRLEREGFVVISAHDGIDGLDKAKREKPDIIILDLILPRLPGEEVCKMIRKDTVICETPIVMLTAKCTEVDRVVGRVVGADAYLIKPFDGGKLVEEINKFINRK